MSFDLLAWKAPAVSDEDEARELVARSHIRTAQRHHPLEPGFPLKGPTTSGVIQPP